MSIQNWSEDIIVVDLPREPYVGDEITATIDSLNYDACSDVILDFSSIGVITSSSIAKLLKLRKILARNERNLILCNLHPRTLNIFRLTGLIDVFKVMDDKMMALATLRLSQCLV